MKLFVVCKNGGSPFVVQLFPIYVYGVEKYHIYVFIYYRDYYDCSGSPLFYDYDIESMSRKVNLKTKYINSI